MTVWTDGEILRVIWRTAGLGQSASSVGPAFDVSRSAILGLVKRVKDAGAQVEAAGLHDVEMLDILHRVLRGEPAERVAKEFGLTRYGVLNMVSGVLVDTAKAGPDGTVLPANRDRVAWPGWWLDDISLRRAVA